MEPTKRLKDMNSCVLTQGGILNSSVSVQIPGTYVPHVNFHRVPWFTVTILMGKRKNGLMGLLLTERVFKNWSYLQHNTNNISYKEHL